MGLIRQIIRDTAIHSWQHRKILFRPFIIPLLLLIVIQSKQSPPFFSGETASPWDWLFISLSLFTSTAISAFYLVRTLAILGGENPPLSFLRPDPREPRLLLALFYIYALIGLMIIAPIFIITAVTPPLPEGSANASNLLLQSIIFIFIFIPLLSFVSSLMILLPDSFYHGRLQIERWWRLDLFDKITLGLGIIVPTILLGFLMIESITIFSRLAQWLFSSVTTSPHLLISLIANAGSLIFYIVFSVLLGVVYHHGRGILTRANTRSVD